MSENKVKRIPKAEVKSPAKTPQQHWRDHVLGMVNLAVDEFPKDCLEIIRRKILDAPKI